MKRNFTIILMFIMVGISSTAFSQVPTNGLIGYWPFNGDAQDEIGVNHGIINGATACHDRFGNTDRAFNFSTSSIYVDTCVLGNLTEASFSIWLMPDSSTLTSIASPLIMGYWGVYINRFTSEGRLLAILDGSSLNNSFSDESNFLITNAWTHLVATNDGFTTKLYINGVLDNSYSETFTWIDNSLGLYLGVRGIGNGAPTDYYNGKLDDFRIYNRALTISEIDSLFNENNPISNILENAPITNQINIFPNPSESLAFIDLGEKYSLVTIRVIDINGKIILAETFHDSKICKLNVESLKSGSYIVSINTNSSKNVNKVLIKQ